MLKSNSYILNRLGQNAGVYMTPAAEPGTYRPVGWVSHGYKNEAVARAFASEAASFFALHGLDAPVFVVRGPTSTCREPFEVCDASGGYTVLHRVKVQPAKAPAAGLPLRAVIGCFGLEAVRGLPLDDGIGNVLYVSDSCLDRDIEVYEDSPSEAFRIHRFYGAATRDSDMVGWIYVNDMRVAQPAQLEQEQLAEAEPAMRG